MLSKQDTKNSSKRKVGMNILNSCATSLNVFIFKICFHAIAGVAPHENPSLLAQVYDHIAFTGLFTSSSAQKASLL